uniref:Uncharacterized protein n=1 Tax=Setaria digitata TaxID=48799 RepID=A0A915Q6G6_9BILA
MFSLNHHFKNCYVKCWHFRTFRTVSLSTRIASLKIQRPCSLTLIGLTNAETMELIFPNWLNRAFVRSGREAAYRPYDLNMPSALLRRPLKDYQMDSPITEHGKICAALIGRGIQLANYEPQIIFTSPELKCIETARSVQRSLHIDDCCLCVEPSLAEYAEFRGTAQRYWLTTEQLQREGILSEQTDYAPLLELDRLPTNETPQEFVNRLQRFYEHIIVNFNGRCAVIVSNITGIFVLNNGTARIPWHLQEPHAYMSSCHLCAVEVTSDGKIEPIGRPILPLTKTLFEAQLTQDFKSNHSKSNKLDI